MGNLLRKGSPRPSKPFLKIKKKSASESGRAEISQGEAHRRKQGAGDLPIVKPLSSGAKNRGIYEASTKPPGARKFRETRRTADDPRRLTFRKSRGESRSNEESRNLRSHPQSCRAHGNFARRGAPQTSDDGDLAVVEFGGEEQRSHAEFTKPR